MRKGTVAAALAASWLILSAAAAAADSVLTVGGAVGWAALAVRDGVAEVSGLARYPVQTLASARTLADPALDLALSFDAASAEGFGDGLGRYAVACGPAVSAVGQARARAGSGAALFAGGEAAGLVVTPGRSALLAAGTRLDDWSIDFWLFPTNMENGEQILTWSASRRSPRGENLFQRVTCLAARNKLEWNFSDFFVSTDQNATLSLALASRQAIVPRLWSHHLIQFEAATGLLEYRVDDKVVGVAYATPTGREGGEVYAPVIGSGGQLTLGGRYNGLIDEFRLTGAFRPSADLRRYPAGGGRLETRFFDLGAANTTVGRIELDGTAGGPVGGQAEIRLFARAGESPYGWPDDEASWTPVAPGAGLEGLLRGRWLQVAAVLYPDGTGEAAPSLEALRVYYAPDEAPPPPTMVAAAALDGAVELRWKASADADLAGYLVYYGEAAGEYFGTAAAAGPSPVDIGDRATVVIDGLRNGTLYFFAVAAYDRAPARHIGACSREVAARPLRTAR